MPHQRNDFWVITPPTERRGPGVCLPASVARDNLRDVSRVGDLWATFINIESGETHDCAAYYAQYAAAENV